MSEMLFGTQCIYGKAETNMQMARVKTTVTQTTITDMTDFVTLSSSYSNNRHTNTQKTPSVSLD